LIGAGDIRVRCAIAGGGPAGMMLGLLLARAGVPVLVLEKHGDFLRDFRGDTIHPSTLEVMHELGLLEALLQRPHQEARTLAAQIGDTLVEVADFRGLPTHCRFIALMPQWDFLDFVAEAAQRYPEFGLVMEAEATELLRDGGRVAGLLAQTKDGPLAVHADLVVAADGRHSTLRERSGLLKHDIGAPIDVLWFRLAKEPGDPSQTMGRIDAGRVVVMIDRGDYWQCAYVIRKGGFEAVRGRGLPAFRDQIAGLAPWLRERTAELREWDNVKLLSVAVDRLPVWHQPGFLCIGDAAHAMSPIGGVGVNLAIQDAVAAANILAGPLRRGAPSEDDLRAVQRRREFPVRVTQRAQVMIQNRIIGRVLDATGPMSPPWPVRLLGRFQALRRLPARLIGMGVRPEHVEIPAS
jgi:2-polyprenyl-6-methoxyphenol hydroxylase-like FAD-dependent oxidoreductase